MSSRRSTSCRPSCWHKTPGKETAVALKFVAGDEAAAVDQARALVERLGFAPIVLGTLTGGGSLIGMAGPLILEILIAAG